MRKISAFARAYRPVSIALIILIQVLLLLSSMRLAGLLYHMQIVLPLWVFIISALIVVLFSVEFKHLRKKYHSRVMVFFIIGFLAFTSMTAFFNNNRTVQNVYSSAEGSLVNPTAEKTLTKKQQRKEGRKLIRELKKQFKNADKKETNVAATILIVLGAIGLLLVLAALSCSIACAGSGALAIIVALLGSFGIISLMVWALKKVNHKKKPAEEIKT